VDKYHASEVDIARRLYDAWQPDSVLDIGCAIGSYLEGFRQCGVAAHDLCGWEPYADYARPYAPLSIAHRIKRKDAGVKHWPYRRFDLVMSIEVAEHIRPEGSYAFAENLTAHAGDTILLTAAPPKQPGKGHINCMPHDFWIEAIGCLGWRYDDSKTKEAIACLGDDDLSLAKNMMVFVVR
jgi:hypothetical protein